MEPVSEEEVALLLVDVVPTTSRLRPNVGRTRAIARTRQSERVRATVNRNRISTARRIQVSSQTVLVPGLAEPKVMMPSSHEGSILQMRKVSDLLRVQLAGSI